MKVLIAKSSDKNTRLLSDIQAELKNSLAKLADTNSATHDVTSYKTKIVDYPQPTSTVGEETVQLTITLVLQKKSNPSNPGKKSKKL